MATRLARGRGASAALLWRLLLSLCVWLALPRALHAQPAEPEKTEHAPSPEDEQKRREAKQRFVKGLELVQSEEWDAALAEFRASQELYPTRVALRNVAISLGQLKRHAEALDAYRELLARFGTALSADERRTVDDAMSQLASNIGRPVVTADQPACTVVVDGRERGKTPLPTAIEVDAGTHTVRVSKAGYETWETQVLVAGAQRKSIAAQLVALRATGTLSVSEVADKPVEVVVDGAVVGRAPWTGTLAPGVHSVFLRGAGDLGTAPSSAVVTSGGTTTLRLRAITLDSVLRVEPTPSNAQVHVDGVAVGSGVWEGKVESGRHKVEVVAEGFVASRREVVTHAGRPERVRVALERDLSNPVWQAGFVPHVYLEALAGPAWAPSLGGGADAACARTSGCERSRPFGALFGARGGYEFVRGVGVELFLGALYLKEETRRKLVASGENGDWTASDYQDSTELFGPAAALSASARFLDETPLTFRLWAGAARLNASFSNQGTFTGTVAYQPPTGPKETASSTQDVSVPEKSARLWAPFFGPEARFGYRVGKRFSLDVGVALLLMFPPSTPRTGSTDVSRREGDRKTALRDVMLPSGNLGRGGVLSLPRENGFGTVFALVPSLAARFDL